MKGVLSVDPRNGTATTGPQESTPADVEAGVNGAAALASDLANTRPASRAAWLLALASALETAADELVALADAETALGEVRLRGELAKAAANARYYAEVGARGRWLRPVVETVPGPPQVDLRRAHLPVGPIAVFGASNFPFQFGVVGHDTCSALAAGCPVLVKAHPAHPRLSARLAEVASAALESAGMPAGGFALVAGFDAGLALVDAPEICAVGFTGSMRGGLALHDRANARPRPIPVFAEMGTVNPVVVTAAGARRSEELVAGFTASFTVGAGQFCTKPGLLLLPREHGLTDAFARAVSDLPGAWLLTRAIHAAYTDGVGTLAAHGARALASGGVPAEGFAARPVLMHVELDALVPGSALLEECFGPVALIAEYDDVDQAAEVLTRLQPSLAATVWTDASGTDPDAAALVTVLAGTVGRVVVDGWPTGVACSDAMHHGGPWPATSRPEASSVGAAALERWTRPVSFQNVPEAALPPALRDEDPWGVR